MTLLSSAAPDATDSPRKPPMVAASAAATPIHPPSSSSPSAQQVLQQQLPPPAILAIPEEVYHVAQSAVKAYPHSKKVGNYLVGKSLGEGSFAKVKEGLHVVTGERVAIKIISKEKAKTDAYVRKNLRREGRILQQIRHANVVQLLEVLETENSYYLVVELCRGGDMMDHIVKKTRLSEAETKRYIRQIVLAIDYMHKLGILHRDLKIENLLLTDSQMVKIIDFGLSNMVNTIEENDGNIVTELCKTQCGSPAYAAPEVLSHKPYGTAVDVWSIGVNMFAMLTGNLPFTVKPFNIKALCQKMMSGEINTLPKDISRSCRDLLMKFLNPQPEARIKLREAMSHPWLQETPPAASIAPARLQASPFPNRLRLSDLSPDIVHYMSRCLSLKAADIGRQVAANTPGACLAAYWLLQQKVERFCRQKNLEFPPSRSQRQQQQEGRIGNGRVDADTEHSADALDQKPSTDASMTAAAGAPTAAAASTAAGAIKTMTAKDSVADTAEPPSTQMLHMPVKRVVDLNATAAGIGAGLTRTGAAAATGTLPLRVQRRPESPVKSSTLTKPALATPPFLAGLYPLKETVRREPSSLDLPTSREKTVLAFSTPQKERIPVFESIKEEATETQAGQHTGDREAAHRFMAQRRVAHLEKKTTDAQFEVTNGFHPSQMSHAGGHHRPSEYTVDTGQGKVRIPASSLPEVFLRHSKLVAGAGDAAGRAKTSVDLQLQSIDTTPSATPVPHSQHTPPHYFHSHVTRARTQIANRESGGVGALSRESAASGTSPTTTNVAAAAAAAATTGLRRVQTDASRTEVATIQARLNAGLPGQQQRLARVPGAVAGGAAGRQLISAKFSPADLAAVPRLKQNSGSGNSGRQTERSKTFSTSTR